MIVSICDIPPWKPRNGFDVRPTVQEALWKDAVMQNQRV
jgi:hypothetical protein